MRGGCFDFDPAGNDPNVPDELPEAGEAGSVIACAKVLPTGCTNPPSYQTAIAPLIDSVCLPCHAAGGTASDRDLTTYANVEQIESTVLSQVYACLMPPPDGGADAAITPTERNELLKWLVCGSPNN
jgi:hypothetical protein